MHGKPPDTGAFRVFTVFFTNKSLWFPGFSTILKTYTDQSIAQRAGIEPGTHLYFLERLRTVDGASIAIERSYILADLFPGLMKNDLNVVPLYQVLAQQYNVQTDRAEMEVSVVYAGEYETQLLPVDQGEPLIKESGQIYDRLGRSIENTQRFLLIDRFQFIS